MDSAAPTKELPIKKRVATLEQQMADILRTHPAASQTAGNDRSPPSALGGMTHFHAKQTNSAKHGGKA